MKRFSRDVVIFFAIALVSAGFADWLFPETSLMSGSSLNTLFAAIAGIVGMVAYNTKRSGSSFS